MKERCRAALERFGAFRILVIGDAILDTYLKGYSERLCREAPVPVINVQDQEYRCGGAANTALNLAAMGADVRFLTVLGRDENGDAMLRELLAGGVSTECIIRSPARRTIAKKRIVAGGNILLRVDEGDTSPLNPRLQESVEQLVREALPDTDALVLSDYGGGIISGSLIRLLRDLRPGYEGPLLVDSRDLARFRELSPTAVKPNYEETCKLLGLPLLQGRARAGQIRGAGEALLELTGSSWVAATMDCEGAFLFERGRTPYRVHCIPRHNSNSIGAGDTFTAVLAMAACAGADGRTAAELASAASSIVLTREETTPCRASELRAHFRGNPKYIPNLTELKRKAEECRGQQKRIVFTNGCFDLLHRGHVSLLNRARKLGDILVVGLNSDRSIRRIKGKDRPINTLEDRIGVLAALECVDFLVSFEEDNPFELLKVLKPDVFVKGRTYTEESLPEAALVKELGGTVKILPLALRFSTTQLIERIRRPVKKQYHVR